MDTFFSDDIAIKHWEGLYYHGLNRLPWIASDIPFELVKTFFELLPAEKLILDFGCGTGRIAKLLDDWGATMIGVDCSYSAIKHALLLRNGFYIVTSSLNGLAKGKFNGLVLWGVLHHYPPQTWFAWLEAAKLAVISPGFLLIGGFDCSDIGFCDKPERTSPTTGVDTYCLQQNVIQETLENLNYEVLSNAVINLKDGVSNEIRTWRYIIGKV